MSDTKPKLKLKREQDGDNEPLKMKSAKSPKDLVKKQPEAPLKKDLQVKKEHESPIKKDSEGHAKIDKAKREVEAGKIVKKVKRENEQVKKDSEAHVKKEPGTLKQSETKTEKSKKESEAVKIVKKEPLAVSKEKGSDVTGKVKIVKKEERIISSGKAASSNDTPKKKKGLKEEADKKSKKVYDLPGQKHDPPDERDPLRIFYESLYQQNQKSEMAEVWMMEHGLLAHDAAKKAFERKKKNQLNQKMGSPVKVSKDVLVKSEKKSSKNVILKSEKKTSTSNGDSKPPIKIKRKLDSDDDDDFIVKPKQRQKTNA